MGLRAGDRVDRYEIMQLLGSGGMGEVYRAYDPKLARAVALKILRFDEGMRAEGAARLLREARAAAALSHANVLTVFDVGEVQEPPELRGLAYIAMELVVGASLRAYVHDDRVSIETRIGWLRDVARALSVAHEAGVVHRDVKLDNVMIRADGTVKVLDFGVARYGAPAVNAWGSIKGITPREAGAEVSVGSGAIVGTPMYMAPEQLRGEKLDGRADQFAWGVVAYQFLVRSGPWKDSGNLLDLVLQILTSEPPPPIALEPKIPRVVSDAIVRALAKDREARFPTMNALAEALDAGAQSREPRAGRAPPVAGPPASQTATTMPFKSGDPPATRASTLGSRLVAARWQALSAALVAVAAVAGLVVALRHAGTVRPPAQPARCAGRSSCGPGALCRHDDGACVPLATSRCRVLASPEEAADDRTLWIGAMYPLEGGLSAPLGVPAMHAIELARQEISDVTHGIPAQSVDIPPRPLGIVACDDSSDALESAKHLVDLRVPAVIGLGNSTDTADLATSVFLPARMLVAATPFGDLVTRIPEPPDAPRLVWRVGSASSQSVGVAVRIVAELVEPRVKHATGGAPLRVAFVHPLRAFALPIVEAVLAKLTFNGVGAIANGARFRDVGLDLRYGEAPPDAARAVGDLVAFAPHVVLFVGEDELVDSIFAPLERSWKTGPRPYYVSVTGLDGDLLRRWIGADAALRRRFLGESEPANTIANAQLVAAYNGRFEPPTTLNGSPARPYDAMYLLAYAAVAAGDGPVTGASLAKAIGRLQPPGLAIDVGPTHLFEVVDRLRRGEPVDLQGITTRFDYDVATGESAVDAVVICFGADESGATSDAVESGVRLDADAGRLAGELRCP